MGMGVSFLKISSDINGADYFIHDSLVRRLLLISTEAKWRMGRSGCVCGLWFVNFDTVREKNALILCAEFLEEGKGIFCCVSSYKLIEAVRKRETNTYIILLITCAKKVARTSDSVKSRMTGMDNRVLNIFGDQSTRAGIEHMA
jgi:hypothetical protein